MTRDHTKPVSTAGPGDPSSSRTRKGRIPCRSQQAPRMDDRAEKPIGVLLVQAFCI
jgi:hypothetical protein